MPKFKVGDSIEPNREYYNEQRYWTNTKPSRYEGGIIKVAEVGVKHYTLVGVIDGQTRQWESNMLSIDMCFDLKNKLTLKRKEHVKTRPRTSTTKEQ